MPVDKELLEILACPKCKQPVEEKKREGAEFLVCTAAGSSTRVLISPDAAYRSRGRRSSDKGSPARESCSSTTRAATRPESAR